MASPYEQGIVQPLEITHVAPAPENFRQPLSLDLGLILPRPSAAQTSPVAPLAENNLQIANPNTIAPAFSPSERHSQNILTDTRASDLVREIRENAGPNIDTLFAHTRAADETKVKDASERGSHFSELDRLMADAVSAAQNLSSVTQRYEAIRKRHGALEQVAIDTEAELMTLRQALVATRNNVSGSTHSVQALEKQLLSIDATLKNIQDSSQPTITNAPDARVQKHIVDLHLAEAKANYEAHVKNCAKLELRIESLLTDTNDNWDTLQQLLADENQYALELQEAEHEANKAHLEFARYTFLTHISSPVPAQMKAEYARTVIASIQTSGTSIESVMAGPVDKSLRSANEGLTAASDISPRVRPVEQVVNLGSAQQPGTEVVLRSQQPTRPKRPRNQTYMQRKWYDFRYGKH